jgi:hypothetical protein
MGGLHPKIIEVSDMMKFAGFDIVIVETVGVGQSEIDIKKIADLAVLAIVPESSEEEGNVGVIAQSGSVAESFSYFGKTKNLRWCDQPLAAHRAA